MHDTGLESFRHEFVDVTSLSRHQCLKRWRRGLPIPTWLDAKYEYCISMFIPDAVYDSFRP